MSLTSLRPIGQIALDMEACYVHRAHTVLTNLRIRSIGWHVDGVYCLPLERAFKDNLDKTLEDERYPSGAPMFKIKQDNKK